jgi:hypothetical protein
MSYSNVLLLVVFLLVASIPAVIGVAFLYLAKPLSRGLATKVYLNYKFMVLLFRVLGALFVLDATYYTFTRLSPLLSLWKSD